MANSDKSKIIISILLPLFSIAAILLFVNITNNTITGSVVFNQNSTRYIDADVSLTTYPDEILPENAYIVITLDNSTSKMSVKEFIQRTGMGYDYTYGSVPAANYLGRGYTGNYTYRLNLSQFNVNRKVGFGNHVFTTSIIYKGTILSERAKTIFVG